MTCRCCDFYCDRCGVENPSTDWICSDKRCSEPVENWGDNCSDHSERTSRTATTVV